MSCHVCRYAYSEAELADLTLRDVANTDWAVDQMKLIANDTHGMGKKPFFFTLGLHKVGGAQAVVISEAALLSSRTCRGTPPRSSSTCTPRRRWTCP